MIRGSWASLRRLIEAEPGLLPLLGALLIFVGLGLAQALATPPLGSIDERVHFSYALEVRDGNLPEIETPVREEIVGLSPKKSRNTIWVSNHPPLFYAAQALAIGEVESEEDLPEAFFRGRLLSIVFTTVGLCFAYLCLRELFGPRSPLPALVIALVATVPHFTHIMSLIHNDTLAFLTGTAALYYAIILLTRGLDAGRYLGLLLATSGALACRISGLLVVVAGLTALVIACFRDVSGGWARKLGLCALAVAGVVLALALSSGWFYLRNIELYGDLSGAAVLFEKFDREPHGSVITTLNQRWIWHSLAKQLGYRYSMVGLIRPRARVLLNALYIAALAGFVVDAVSRLRARERADFELQRLWAALWTPAVLSVLMLAAVFVLNLVSIFAFRSAGGYPHARYLLPYLWILVVLFAIGLVRFGKWLPVFALVLTVVLQLLSLDEFVARVHRVDGRAMRDLLLVDGPTIPWGARHLVTAALACVTVGLSLVVTKLPWPDD
ncbi:MAG: glycosyltransferase family 39 protein [Myxococcales bacterium]|nr:glycosyltransferase family 39 protein [Myxococcales bacterium]